MLAVRCVGGSGKVLRTITYEKAAQWLSFGSWVISCHVLNSCSAVGGSSETIVKLPESYGLGLAYGYRWRKSKLEFGSMTKTGCLQTDRMQQRVSSVRRREWAPCARRRRTAESSKSTIQLPSLCNRFLRRPRAWWFGIRDRDRHDLTPGEMFSRRRFPSPVSHFLAWSQPCCGLNQNHPDSCDRPPCFLHPVFIMPLLLQAGGTSWPFPSMPINGSAPHSLKESAS